MDCSLPGSFVHGILQARYWSELPFSVPGDLPNPGIEPAYHGSPVLVGRFFTSMPPGKPLRVPPNVCDHELKVRPTCMFFPLSLTLQDRNGQSVGFT